jgi:hypothetical protein
MIKRYGVGVGTELGIGCQGQEVAFLPSQFLPIHCHSFVEECLLMGSPSQFSTSLRQGDCWYRERLPSGPSNPTPISPWWEGVLQLKYLPPPFGPTPEKGGAPAPCSSFSFGWRSGTGKERRRGEDPIPAFSNATGDQRQLDHWDHFRPGAAEPGK